MPFKDETHLEEFTIGGAKLSDIQIEEEDLHKPDGIGRVEYPSEYRVNFELTPESVKNLTILCGDTKPSFKPEGKTNNWYKIHGYKMNRRIGRKWISRHMHELNDYIREIVIHDIVRESNGYCHGEIEPGLEAGWYNKPWNLCEVQHAEE